MRSALLDAARGFGLAVHETRLELSALRTMREVMLCNAVIGVWPVRQLGDMTFPAGPVAGRFRRHVDAAGAAL
jgi:4-amino-4-deoxychorismate lyase